MDATHTATLHLPNLPMAARIGHVVPQLATASLLSVGQLCDAGCEVTFTPTHVHVTHGNTNALSGIRSPHTKLWEFHLPHAPHVGLSAIGTPTSADLVAFSHAALFSPTLSTLQKALELHILPPIAGLTLAALKRHPPQSIPMIKGHLDQTRKNQRSTKATAPAEPVADPDSFPTPGDGIRTHACYACVVEAHGQVYSDQTGRFVTPSSTGNNYIMVVYDYDSNAILVEPIRNRQAATLVAAYQVLHTRLCEHGCRPQLQRLDNEASDALKDFLHQEGINFQLVPPHVHRRNAAERAIRTFKNHFIAGLCSVDKDFPMHLWDQLLPQAELTLNNLRASRLNPAVSAWTQLYGPYDFNRTPMGPPGIRVVAHVKPDTRTSWAPHGLDGWYLGPALEHYRCYRIWINATRSTRICDTVAWLPTKVPMPTASSVDYILTGIQDIVQALQHPSPNSPLAPLTDSQSNSLRTVMDILHKAASPPQVEPTPLPTPAPVAPTADPPTSTPTHPPAPAILAPKTVKWFDVEHAPPPPAPPLRVANPPHAAPLRVPTRTLRSGRAHTAAILPTYPYLALYGNALHPDTGLPAEYPALARSSDGASWLAANTTEIRRLAENQHGVPNTNTMRFLALQDIPSNASITYLRVVCAHRPEKEVPFRVRWTVGGDRVEYLGDVTTPTADLTTAKILFNSVVSTPNAKCVMGDLKDFYLGTPMERKDYAYMKIPVHMVPAVLLDEYGLRPLIRNGFLYVEISRGMYGLPQAGRLANDQLQAFLAPHGYAPCSHTAGLWRHATRPLAFALVVDDFAIKYIDKADADHLLHTLSLHYKMTTDWDATKYCGITLEWDYNKRTVDLSMPGYIDRALQRFAHTKPRRPEHSPHAWQKPQYGARVQYAQLEASEVFLDAANVKRVQEVVGVLLYYARAVDPTLLVALGTIASQQAKATNDTMKAVTHVLNYCATHPSATIRYIASDMVLWVHSDASYLTAPKARSRASGYHFLSTRPALPPNASDEPPPDNGPIHVLCQIMRPVLASAAEAEMGALFVNAKHACPLRVALQELGHEQPPTPLQTDNTTATGLATDSIKQKHTKAIDMRFYWLRDRVRQKQFHVFWKPGKTNRADYFSKHHPAAHHQEIRSSYLHERTAPSANYYACLTEPPSSPAHTGSGEGVLIPSSGNPDVSNPDPHAWSQLQSRLQIAPHCTRIASQCASQCASRLLIASQCAPPVRAGPTASLTTTRLQNNSCRTLASVVSTEALTGTPIVPIQHTIT